jgi:predicted peroxiredoxin
MSDKLVIVLKTGREDAEIVSTAIAIAVSAILFDKNVLLVLQGKAISLARKGFLGKISFPPFEPVADLLATYMENGGRVLVCTPGIEGYHVSQDDIIEGVQIAGGATFITEIEDAQVLTY